MRLKWEIASITSEDETGKKKTVFDLVDAEHSEYILCMIVAQGDPQRAMELWRDYSASDVWMMYYGLRAFHWKTEQ